MRRERRRWRAGRGDTVSGGAEEPNLSKEQKGEGQAHSELSSQKKVGTGKFVS
jgi:hypothetical protein